MTERVERTPRPRRGPGQVQREREQEGDRGQGRPELITAQEQNWDVGVVATPQGLGFIDAAAVEAQTGYPILVGEHAQK